MSKARKGFSIEIGQVRSSAAHQRMHSKSQLSDPGMPVTRCNGSKGARRGFFSDRRGGADQTYAARPRARFGLRYGAEVTMNIDQAIAELQHVSIEDRLRLAQAVWDSLPDELAVATTREQDEELAARVSKHAADPSSSITRTELEERLKNRK